MCLSPINNTPCTGERLPEEAMRLLKQGATALTAIAAHDRAEAAAAAAAAAAADTGAAASAQTEAESAAPANAEEDEDGPPRGESLRQV